MKQRIEKPGHADVLTRPHHERIGDPVFRRAVDLIDTGNLGELRVYLKRHPGLTREHVTFEDGNYFRNPTLLEFVAENPVRWSRLPLNICDLTRVILDAGVEVAALTETLMLVATGCVPRECGVQTALIDLLCDWGADPNPAAETATVLFEMHAVEALLRRGGPDDFAAGSRVGQD